MTFLGNDHQQQEKQKRLRHTQYHILYPPKDRKGYEINYLNYTHNSHFFYYLLFLLQLAISLQNKKLLINR